MLVLGLDPGEERVGAAISNDELTLAFPLETIPATPGAALLARLKALVQERSVELVVVGHPLRLDGSRGMPARKAEAFAKGLEAALQKRVILWDERFSTSAAEQSLRESGVRGSRRREVVDQSAAALILQSYLDAEGS